MRGSEGFQEPLLETKPLNEAEGLSTKAREDMDDWPFYRGLVTS